MAGAMRTSGPVRGPPVLGNRAVSSPLTASTLARDDGTVKVRLPADAVSEDPRNIVDVGSSYISGS